MSRTRLLAASVAAAALTAATATPASAAGPKLTLIGLGATAMTSDGGASYSATLSGDPIGGDSYGELHAADGTLPAVGTCEPATATLRVEDTAGRFVALSSTGSVCGEWLPLGTMQRFTGRFTVESSSVRRLLRSAGVLDVRLMNGQSDIYATS